MPSTELRLLELSDVSQKYVGWLNDPEVVRYTEQRWAEHTLDSTRRYLKAVIESPHDFLYAIWVDGDHIGNIKLGPINHVHGVGETSYFIGDRAFWGRGFASIAIGLIVEIGFGDHGLHKITAGTYAPNLASEKALLKNGFVLEGVRKDHYVFEGRRVDARLFGKVRPD